MRILLIEDDEAFHYLCQMAFKRAGEALDLTTAFDGLEALAILRDSETKPDVILVDINMPRMNGHEFLQEYSQTDPGNLPVVAMLTSSEESRDRDPAMRYPFVMDYFVKPLTGEHIQHIKQIHEAVRSSIAKSSMD
ncbi:response regulator [Rhodopirellula sp. P2]|uniref:response regulator n=1 Tax=Rhodopirellula sp. P2 TaxID=2127060 RepID=UPI002368E6C9|nr:response regulator [Rhodopirellula sp. P2]WDQ19097.1 response regulator [Rhodopirellula sp. P2]